MMYFLKAEQANQMSAAAVGKRKREVGLVVPAKYAVLANCQTAMVTTLVGKLIEKRDRYRNFDMKFDKYVKTVNDLSNNFDS